MNRLLKKTVVGITAVAMAASMSTGVIAQTEMSNMVFAGYDTTMPDTPNKIYNEVINGSYTNKQILVPVEPEFRVEGYENVYPYAGYSRMYLEGHAQNITAYNNLFPQWETRYRDNFWELKYPYMIWERQQTKVNNKTWQWDYGNELFNIPDIAVLNKTNRPAVVTSITMKDYGFGKYNNKGELLTKQEQYMYSQFKNDSIDGEPTFTYSISDAIAIWDNLVGDKGLLSTASLSAKDENNRYIVTDEQIAAAIPVVKSKYITAKFNKNGSDGLTTKSVAAEYLKHGSNWDWDYFNEALDGSRSFAISKTADISWSKPYYEMAEPYYYYQYLTVNGVVLDGTNGKDRIFRYTGGKASPVITWKFAFFQNAKDLNGNLIDGVYEVVERKYVDGVAAVDAYGKPIYRVPTGEYGNTYFVLNGTTIEQWVVDKAGHKSLLKTAENWTGNLGGLIDAYTRGAVHYNASVPEEKYKRLP